MASAQTQNSGAISGEVKDTSGAVLPGVTVEAASPALIEKVRTVVTDGNGRYTLTDLRPGTYTVSFTLTGFATVKREGIQLTAGVTANVGADMKVGDLQETITVTGATPIVDVANASSKNVLTREVLDSLPTSRTVAAFAAVTVGALTTGQSLGGGDVGGSKGDTVYGMMQIHGSQQGMRTLDGMRMSSAYNVAGSTRNQVNQIMVQEIVLDTSAASVETESSGMNMNVVPKDGGNLFSATATFEGTNNSFQAKNNISDELAARGLTTTAPIQKIYDNGFGVGGPIAKDKLWFYGGYRNWGSVQNIAGIFFNKPANQASLTPSVVAAGGFLPYSADTTRPAFYDRNQWDTALRLTYQLNAKNKIAVYGGVQNYCWCNAYFTTNQEASWDFKVYPNNNWIVSWTNTATNKLLLSAGASLRQDRQFNGAPPIPGYPVNSAIAVLDTATGIGYGSRYISTGVVGDTEWGDMGNQYAYQTRASMSYVTGSHNFKVGENSMTGVNKIENVAPLYPYQYIMSGNTPIQIKEGAYPYHQYQRLGLLLGVFASDQWTINHLTLNLGLRFDYLNGYIPAYTYPGSASYNWPGGAVGAVLPNPISFPEVDNAPNWKDISPRLGATWDVFGNGKTAIKGTYGKYVNFDTTALTKLLNPVATLVANTSRSWNDNTTFPVGDPRNGNKVPDCNLLNPAANGECGPFLNSAFGTSVVNTRFAPDVTQGWGVRPNNQQISAVLQQEIRPGLGVTAGYYRTWYGNKTITNNTAVTASDFTQYCVTAPTDSRLPTSGQQICGIYDLNPNKVGQVNNLVQRATGLTEVFQGIDLTANWRFGKGGLLNGGIAFGRTDINNCDVPYPGAQAGVAINTGSATQGSAPQMTYCKFSWPWAGQTQAKAQFAYPIWYDFKFAATWQNSPGLVQAATLGYTAANTTLGRPFSTASVAVVTLMSPNSLFEPRFNQIDIRLSRKFTFGKLRLEPRVDLYNLTNSITALGSVTGYSAPGGAWLRPTDALSARIAKFGVQVDF